MSSKDHDDLVAIAVQRASEIAKHVPEALQVAAFNKAFEAIMGGGSPANHGRAEAGHKRQVPARVGVVAATGDQDRATQVLAAVERTSDVEIKASKSPLENALRILLLARDAAGVDGMTPAEVGRVLSERFRISVATNTIQMALSRAPAEASRRRRGQGFEYLLMAPGEERLNAGPFVAQTGPTAGTAKRGRAKKSPQRGAAAQPAASGKAVKAVAKSGAAKLAKTKPAGRVGRPGPMQIVARLLDAGYFASARTAGDVLEHVRHKNGYLFKVSDIAVALLRLVRSDRIERHKNTEGQYEYKAR